MSTDLNKTFSALADPIRRKMLVQLSKKDLCVSDLAKPHLGQISLPAVTKHLKVLEGAGLVTKSKDAQWRSCHFNPQKIKKASDWLLQYASFWEQSLDRLTD